MSRENAAKFLETIDREPSFFQKVMDGAATAGAWLQAAASHGLETSLDELRSVSEELLGRPIEPANLIGELRALFEGELLDASLDAVSGGVVRSATVRVVSATSVARIANLRSLTTDFFISDSGPSWVDSPHGIGRGIIVLPE